MIPCQSTIKMFTIISTWYPDELEIKDTTESDQSASYLDILPSIDSIDSLTTTLNDKGDDFHFAIVNFLFYEVICHFHLFIVCTFPSWFDTQDHLLGMITFQRETNYWQKNWCSRLQWISFKSFFRKSYGRYNDLVCDYKSSLAEMLNDLFHTLC
jgi:hypothetical protein